MTDFQVLRRLLQFLAPYKKELAGSILSGLATIGASVGLMGTAAYLISAAALRPSIAELQVAIVLVRFFGLSRGAFRYLERLLSHSVNLGLLANLRVWLYCQLEPLAPAGLTYHRAGDLLTRLVSDIDTLENFYVRVFAPLGIALLATLGMVLFLGSYSPLLALLISAALLLAGVGLPVFAHHLSRSPARQMVDRRAALNAALVDCIQGSADLLVFGQENAFLNKIMVLDTKFASAQRQLAWLSAGHAAISTFIQGLGVWGVLALAIPLVASGKLEGVLLAALVLSSLASFEAVLPLPQAFQFLQASLQSARRIFSLVDQEPPIKPVPNPSPMPVRTDLSIHDLSFTYPGSTRPVFQHFYLDLPAGKKVAVLGPSGSGKTTLINLILRFWEPESGKIRLGSVDVRLLDPYALRRRIAVVSQDAALFNLSIFENIALACPQASRAQVEAAANLAQLKDFILSLPEGYATQVGERGLRLSAGQVRRIAIARALLQDAPILILDEPTAHLDALTSQALMQDLVKNIFPRRTILLVTHQRICLEAMDTILDLGLL